MAYLFDNVSEQYLGVDNPSVTDAPFTLSARFNTNEDALAQGIIGLHDASSTKNFMRLEARTDKIYDPLFFYSVDGGWNFSSVDGIALNTWHHACAVAVSTTSRTAYLDGVAGNHDTAEETISGIDRLGIGCFYDSSISGYFSGMIAECALWNVALTVTEVGILAEGYSPLFVRPENLVSYWPLVRDLRDIVGNYNLTAYGSPTVAPHPRVFYPTRPFYSQIASAIAIKSVSSVSWASVKQVSSIAKANIKKISGV